MKKKYSTSEQINN